MIGCDKCGVWYHGICVGMTEEQAKLIDSYHCPPCQKLFGKPKLSNSSFHVLSLTLPFCFIFIGVVLNQSWKHIVSFQCFETPFMPEVDFLNIQFIRTLLSKCSLTHTILELTSKYKLTICLFRD
jgi:hypothetical protein